MGVTNSTRKLGIFNKDGKKWSKKLMRRPLMCEPSSSYNAQGQWMYIRARSVVLHIEGGFTAELVAKLWRHSKSAILTMLNLRRRPGERQVQAEVFVGTLRWCGCFGFWEGLGGAEGCARGWSSGEGR